MMGKYIDVRIKLLNKIAQIISNGQDNNWELKEIAVDILNLFPPPQEMSEENKRLREALVSCHHFLRAIQPDDINNPLSRQFGKEIARIMEALAHKLPKQEAGLDEDVDRFYKEPEAKLPEKLEYLQDNGYRIEHSNTELEDTINAILDYLAGKEKGV
jgi:hypothetical protein